MAEFSNINKEFVGEYVDGVIKNKFGKKITHLRPHIRGDPNSCKDFIRDIKTYIAERKKM